MLLSPHIPLLFMGEEYAETAPFLYFVSHGDPALVEAVRRGRRQEFARFTWEGEVPDPQDEATFLRSKVNPVLATKGRGQVLHRLYRNLIDLRRTVPALGCRGLSPPEITVDPSGQMLDIRRRESGSCVRVLFHLGEVKGYYQTTWPEGPWHKILRLGRRLLGRPRSDTRRHDPCRRDLPLRSSHRRSFAVVHARLLERARHLVNRYVCIHGHFYQPPRENPWLEMVELQDSAYPFHDWNERITAECYAPNSVARVLDADGRIARLVNNYSRISFNFGPTLLAWMEDNASDVYQRVLDADRESREQFHGHGSAMAQVYNHIIMPLANREDKETQVAWGVRDFRHRFGREPEGMWLAETAVDLPTLEVLAEHGIRFTVLAPNQASRVRRVGSKEWTDVSGGRIDPSVSYVQRLPSGRSIGLFFYDGPVSQAVAFEKLLTRGEALAGRLMSAFSDDRQGAQLVHIATDGESYGHHHPHGDMALAYALDQIAATPGVTLTNYGEFLEKHPPQWEVEIFENSSWSCVHGLERWRSNCGCNSGRPGWHQNWREPLRAALDGLRDAGRPLYERARVGLAEGSLGRPQRLHRRLAGSASRRLWTRSSHGTRGGRFTARERSRAIKLLEMQRHALLMYTSCGWFFDEDLGNRDSPDPDVCRADDPARGGVVRAPTWKPAFLEQLARAPSNLPSPPPDRPRSLREVCAAGPARLAEYRRPLRRRLALPVLRGDVARLLLRRGPERRTASTRLGRSSWSSAMRGSTRRSRSSRGISPMPRFISGITTSTPGSSPIPVTRLTRRSPPDWPRRSPAWTRRRSFASWTARSARPATRSPHCSATCSGRCSRGCCAAG